MENEIYEWPFYLIENNLTLEKGDYLAKINTGRTKTAEDIAIRFVKERTEFRKETIINILSTINEIKTEFILQGHSVNDGLTLYDPAITGIFPGETVFNPNENACVVNVRVINEIRKQLSQIKTVYTGYTVDNGGAVIEKVVDSETESINEFITPGGAITITGKKIRVVAGEEVDLRECIVFENQEDGMEYVLEKPIITNDSGKVIVPVPVLPPGNYKLTIRTLYSSTSAMLKAPRYITFKISLTVA